MGLLADNFYFSQSSLETYKTCPLKFRFRYIDGLYWPAETEGPLKLAARVGKAFHLMAQRYFLGIPPAFPAGGMGTLLRDWHDILGDHFPREGTWLPEVSLRLNRSSFRLTATYDVVHLPGDGKVLIYEWKTGEQPLRWKRLQMSLQTVVYRYLMVEAGETITGEPVSPEEVTVIYWNPRFPNSRVVLKYNEKDYRQDRRALEQLVAGIMGTAYRDFKPAADPKACLTCEYRMTCKGLEPEGREEVEEELEIVPWDDAPEIAY